MIFFVSSICYRPTDLSLLKEFSKNVNFSNSYNLPSQSAVLEDLDVHGLPKLIIKKSRRKMSPVERDTIDFEYLAYFVPKNKYKTYKTYKRYYATF